MGKDIAPSEIPSRRVLSIQSHVSSGFVGNRAATLVLQLLGWDVDTINTVQYSNHAGYGRGGGPKTDASQIKAIFAGLKANGLIRYSRLLTGYAPGSEVLGSIEVHIQEMKATTPSLIYVLDPVMGDDGRLYVDTDVVPIYRDNLLPLATIITPNWFEVEMLTKIPLNTVADLRTALRILHKEHGVPNVVISSLTLHSKGLKAPRDPAPESDIYTGKALICLCSALGLDPENDPSISTVHTMTVDRIKGYFSGVGDLFSALVTASYDPDQKLLAGQTPISSSTALAVGVTQKVLYATQKHYLSLPEEERPDTDAEEDKKDPDRRARRMRGRELRLVQSMGVVQQAGIVSSPMEEWQDFWTSGVVASL
ncbi:putative pyridoxal kinase [Tulasnella sp. 330]|nr:putative pyridoxal kinase [Tulasnella sp. 330]KAG8877426.1 putative pyridoxal kinase [Tulasnella sp. 331]KAG8885133.1 putative pyridoxal kinase [Tulasnella sp. 332]